MEGEGLPCVRTQLLCGPCLTLRVPIPPQASTRTYFETWPGSILRHQECDGQPRCGSRLLSVLISGSVWQVEALGGYSSEYWVILSHPHTPRKKQDTKQRYSTLLLWKNTERKACCSPQWESHGGGARGGGSLRQPGGAQYDGRDCKHWLDSSVTTPEGGRRMS